jgi:hypothetical protein
MKMRNALLLAVLSMGTLATSAQSPSIVGTWLLTAADKLLPDGTRTSDLGDNPHGLGVFTAEGHYAVEIDRTDRGKFSSGDARKETVEEYKEIFLGMTVHFGRYVVDPVKSTITFKLDRASFSNWDDTTQVRTYELKGDELAWNVPPRPDGSAGITVLRRVQ